MLSFQVAGLRVNIQAEDLSSVCLLSLENFLARDKDNNKELLFEVDFADDINAGLSQRIGAIILTEGECGVYVNQGHYYVVNEEAPGGTACLMRVSLDYDRVTLKQRSRAWLDQFYRDQPYLTNKELLNFVIRMAVLRHSGLVLHASTVKYQGSAYAFLGHSGTGKSTHSSLWINHFGAVLLNDDAPVVRIVGGRRLAYGTFWSGSVDCYVNDVADLKGLCLLQQATENNITRLAPLHALAELLPLCAPVVWDTASNVLMVENLGRLVETTPIYILRCRPDLAAAELALSLMNK